ncbi:lytic transglycosylase [Shewanella sp. OPT22]|nr:lytic transglycosylase [Shewanella sp. OPT22]
MRFSHYFLTGCFTVLAGCQSVPTQLNKPTTVIEQPLAEAESRPDLSTDIEQTQMTIDVWERLRLGLDMPVPDKKLVNQYRNWYLKHQKHILRVTDRAHPYMYMIIEELEKRNLPLELALLPFVESSFDPFAYSHGSASGLWQFTSPMARHFGLKIDWWYDGRRDVHASTIAALDFLEYLYKKTNQNWLYAIAAYNTGEGRVLRAVKRNKRKGMNTDFWSLDLPTETERYVPQLLALADIIKHSEKYGIKLSPIPNDPQIRVVKVKHQMDLAVAADYAGLTTKELHQYNPGYNRWATGPKGPHTFVLPLESADEFELALNETSPEDHMKWQRYKIKSGDNIGVIAKRFNTTPSVIKSVNRIQGNTIIAGKHLLIPVATKDLSHYTLTAKARLERKQNIKRGDYKVNHNVQSGESLWTIARKYSVKTSQLARWNNMAPKDPLRAGKKLVVWQKGAAVQSKSVIRNINYKVRNGDSLARIADKFNVRISDLLKWNQLDAKEYLQPGQMLNLYVDVTNFSS